MIIANTLFAADIPYRYECPLRLNRNLIFHPDFTILNRRTLKVYYWEHLGKMSDPGYVEDQMFKFQQYENAGLYPGDPILTTRESDKRPLSTYAVKRMIERYLV